MTTAQLSLSLRDRFGRVPVSATVGLITLMVFASGFGVARLLLRSGPAVVTSIPLTDYSVELPEGSTTISITDPLLQPEQIVEFTVNRTGASVTGVPGRTVQLSPRPTLGAETAAYFRSEMMGVFGITDTPGQRANAIRNWLFHKAKNRAGPGLTTREPREAYEQMIKGGPVLCGNLADIYVGLCEAAGLSARTVSMSLMVRGDGFGADTHVAAEVWLPEFGGWVYQDPTFNCDWEVNGQPAGALALHQALLAKRAIVRGPREQPAEPDLLNYYVDPRLFFSHLYYEYQIGGQLLYYLDEETESINPRDANWIQTDNAALLLKQDPSDAPFQVSQGEVAPGIFVQLIKGKLFVRDRRPRMRGIRVRATSGPVMACAYDHWRAGKLGVFDQTNFVRNGEFLHAETSAQIADDWSVDGRVEGTTIVGGQGLGVGPGGRLFQQFRVEPNRSYVLYSKINVSRGRVEWRLTDLSSQRHSNGITEAGRIEEILSDTVVSDSSGMLEVSFTAPEGGGFRILDVIVCEVPRGDASRESLSSVRHPLPIAIRSDKKGTNVSYVRPLRSTIS